MKVLTLLILQGALAYKCNIDYGVMEHTELRWVKNIFPCRLSNLKTNKNSTNSVQLSTLLFINQFVFSSEKQELMLFVLVDVFWFDNRLTWDPDKHDELKSIAVLGYRHLWWTPALSVVNSLNSDDSEISFHSCFVTYQGRVHCKQSCPILVHCGVNWSDWPFDTQLCKIELTTYPQNDSTLNHLVSGANPMFISAKNGEWQLIDLSEGLQQNSNKTWEIKLLLKRNAGVLSCIFVAPSLLLSTLTFSTLFVHRKTRSFIFVFSLLCHLHLLSDISMDVAKQGKETPGTLSYFRGSLIVTAVLTAYSLAFNFAWCIACPNWIVVFNKFVNSTPVRFFIWPNVVRDQSANIKTDWIKFADIVDSMWIMITVVVYISIYCVFMPYIY